MKREKAVPHVVAGVCPFDFKPFRRETVLENVRHCGPRCRYLHNQLNWLTRLRKRMREAVASTTPR
jgi:hypothetical protein